MHRIPRSPFVAADAPRRAPVYLQHGLLDSSSTWVLAGRERGLGNLICLSNDVEMSHTDEDLTLRSLKHSSYPISVMMSGWAISAAIASLATTQPSIPMDGGHVVSSGISHGMKWEWKTFQR